MPATSTDTRSQILDVTWRLLRRRGAAGLTVGEIAKAAGVTRQLIYFHFENRAGLLTAVARRHDRESGFAARVVESRTLAPVEGLERLLDAWFGYIPDILPVARGLEVAAASGDDGGAAWYDRMGDLREAFRQAVERVAEDGRLAEGWTVDEATDWIWARSHVSTWEHLVGERGWKPRAYCSRSIRSILAEVVG